MAGLSEGAEAASVPAAREPTWAAPRLPRGMLQVVRCQPDDACRSPSRSPTCGGGGGDGSPGKRARCPDATPTDSTRSSDSSWPEARVCRFCLEGDEGLSDSEDCAVSSTDIFVHPCPCRGSNKFVHLDCLIQCFRAQGDWHNFRCPTCKQLYEGRALRELAQLSWERMASQFGPASPQVAHTLCYLAQAHAQMGDVRKSKELLEEGLTICEARFGKGHVATVATLAELASAYGKMGDVLTQKELLERCLGIKEQHFGRGHINTAVTLNNLATAHSELGNVEQEKALLERSLEIKEKHFGKGHVSTTAALVNLAGVYSELGDVSRGLELLEWSLAIEERHFGAGHVETAITLNNLALACGEGGDVRRMRELLQRSLRIKERHFGAEHRELCLTLANLGMACAAQQEQREARAYCDRALAACSAPEVQSSRRHGVVLLRTAAVHFAFGEDGLATEVTRQSIAILQQALGPGATARILALECTRMSRIWIAVDRPDVVRRLEELTPRGADAADSGQGAEGKGSAIDGGGGH